MILAVGGRAAFPSFAAALHRPWRTTGYFATGFYHDWRTTAAAIEPLLPRDALIVSDVWHAPIYYLHHPSMRLYPAYRNAEAGDWETHYRRRDVVVQHAAEFVNAQLQRPVWVIVSDGHWRRTGYYEPALVSLIEGKCRSVTLPPGSTLVAFDCSPPPTKMARARNAASQ